MANLFQSSQYYLVSQLPAIEGIDSKQLPITEKYYRDLCERFLDEKSLAIVRTLSLEPPKRKPRQALPSLTLGTKKRGVFGWLWLRCARSK